MAGMFEPDDDRDPDGGWESYEDYLRDRGDDMEYPDSVPDDVRTDRIDCDPDLFGELPDDPDVERLPDGNRELISAEQEHRWNRQITLVELTGACVRCDADVEYSEYDGINDIHVEKYKCTECGESWTVRDGGESWNYTSF